MRKMTYGLMGILTTTCCISSAAMAGTIADFSGGNGSTAPNQYQGTAGDGWTTAWITGTASDLYQNGTTDDQSPLDPNESIYLTVSGGVSSETPISNKKFTNLQRGYTQYDPSKSTVISFLYRIDDDNNNGGFFRIHGTQGQAPSHAGTFGNDAWVVMGQVGDDWKGQDYNGVSSDGVTIGAGLTVETGDVYQFTIIENNIDQTYEVSVQNLTDSSAVYSLEGLNYRTSTYDTPYLRYTVETDTGATNSSTYGYSTSSISIVPEPSTLTLGLMAGSLLYLRRMDRN